MAHAHDRTLLASLSFGDPDKKEPLHDLGCRYVSRPEICDAMNLKNPEGFSLVFDDRERACVERPITKGQNQYKTLIGFIDVVLPFKYYFEGFRRQKTGRVPSFNSREEAWAHDRALYESEIRWIAKTTEEDIERSKKLLWHDWEEKAKRGVCEQHYEVPEYTNVSVGTCASNTIEIFVEVKIKPIGLGDIIRQINLYREFVGGSWILAAAFDMPEALVVGLREHGIFPLQLGENFRKWSVEQQALTQTNTAAVV